MLTIPDRISNILSNDGVLKNFMIHFPNGEHEDVFNSHIEEESVNFTESVNSSNEFALGLCECPEISMYLRNVDEINVGTQIECYNCIKEETPHVMYSEKNRIATWESDPSCLYYCSYAINSSYIPEVITYSDMIVCVEITTNKKVKLSEVSQEFESREGTDYIMASDTSDGTFFRINFHRNPKHILGGLDFIFKPADDETDHSDFTFDFKIYDGCYIENDDVIGYYYPIKYGLFTINESSINSDDPTQQTIRANNYLMSNLTNDIYDDKSFVKTKKSFTYTYDPLKRAIAAAGISDSNMFTLGECPKSETSVHPSTLYSKKKTFTLSVKKNKKSSKKTNVKLTFNFWFNGDTDLYLDEGNERCGYFAYGKCTDDLLIKVSFFGDYTTNVDEYIEKDIAYIEEQLVAKNITVTKKLKTYIKDEVLPYWYNCYFSSIKNYKGSGSSYTRYTVPHRFNTCYYTKFSADSSESYDYILAIPLAFRLTVSASSAIETWGKKKEFTIRKVTRMSSDRPRNGYFLMQECESDLFGEFTITEKATKIDDSSYYMLFNNVKVRDILSSYFEFKGAYGRVSRDGTFEMVSLLDELGLTPADDLYPSDSLYPLGAGCDYIFEPNEYQKIFHKLSEELPFGVLYAYYLDSSDETQMVTMYMDGYDEDSDPETYQAYVISDNLLITYKNWTASKLKTYLKKVVDVLSRIRYTKGEIKMIGRPEIQAGDTITLRDSHGIHCLIVSNRTLTGIQHLEDDIKSV